MCSEVGKKLHWYMGVWGRQPPEASNISKNQIKWKPDIYFLKRKLQFFFLKAYVVNLERNYIDIWGSGGNGLWGPLPPEASDISKNQIKWKPDIFFKKESFIFFFRKLYM